MPAPPGAPVIREAISAELEQLRAIARAAYEKYVVRIGREPAPMNADFAAYVAARQAVVIEHDGQVAGYMIAWARPDDYFVDNLAIDLTYQGQGLGRILLDHAVK